MNIRDDKVLRLGHRPLNQEPLTEADWQLVYFAYLGFQRQIEAIVVMARAREAK